MHAYLFIDLTQARMTIGMKNHIRFSLIAISLFIGLLIFIFKAYA